MREKQFAQLAAAAILLLALTARLLPGARTIDDAYITYRYAQNLLAGEGLVYNPGERVLGTTTPLYAGLLAGIGLVTGGIEAPFPQIALGVNAVADAGVCLLLIRIGRRLGFPLAGIAAGLAWAVLPFSVTFAIGGLETSLFVLLLTAAAHKYLTERFTIAAFLAALALLTRPDAALLAFPLALDRLYMAVRKEGRAPIRRGEIAAAGLPLLAWLIPAALYYGSPMPHSVSAKAAAYNLAADAAFTRLVQHYATPFMENLSFGSAGILTGVFLYPFLALIGTRRVLKNHPRAWPWLAFPWLWFAAYAIANPLIFRWYLTPPLAAYIFAILTGLAAIRQDLTGADRGRAISGLVGVILLFGPTHLLLQGWTLTPDHGPRRPAPEMAWIKLELKYIEAAERLAPTLAEFSGTPVLAAADIGALGYHTGVPILDTLGLVSPGATDYYPTPPEIHANAYAVAPELILDEQPDFIVLLEVYGRGGLFKDPGFHELYEQMDVVETNIYASAGMPIFRKR